MLVVTCMTKIIAYILIQPSAISRLKRDNIWSVFSFFFFYLLLNTVHSKKSTNARYNRSKTNIFLRKKDVKQKEILIITITMKLYDIFCNKFFSVFFLLYQLSYLAHSHFSSKLFLLYNILIFVISIYFPSYKMSKII